MIRKIVFLLFCTLCLSFSLIGVEGHDPAYEVVAVYGSTPVIDGVVNLLEWSDADSVSFNNTEVFVKQDGVNLYVGFNNSEALYHDEDGVIILIDVDDDDGPTLQPDDIGLVVIRNGSTLEANVTSGAWTLTNMSGWNVSLQSASDMWQVEFNITYSKINVVAGVEKSLGVVFGCHRRLESSYPFCWPLKYYSDILDEPSEWGGIISTGYDWIPEFPSLIILPLFMLSTLLATLVYRRKRAKPDWF